MTREEKLWSMTMKALVVEAEKLGVKIDKKGSKEKAIQKMLAAEATQIEVLESPAEVVEEEGPAVEEPIKKAEKKAKQPKRTFENLLADIPSIGNFQFTPDSKRRAVHVKRGNKRIFGYSGAVIVVNRKEYLTGITDYDKKGYGYVVAPTQENMLILMKNANR